MSDCHTVSLKNTLGQARAYFPNSTLFVTIDRRDSVFDSQRRDVTFSVILLNCLLKSDVLYNGFFDSDSSMLVWLVRARGFRKPKTCSVLREILSGYTKRTRSLQKRFFFGSRLSVFGISKECPSHVKGRFLGIPHYRC